MTAKVIFGISLDDLQAWKNVNYTSGYTFGILAQAKASYGSKVTTFLYYKALLTGTCIFWDLGIIETL